MLGTVSHPQFVSKCRNIPISLIAHNLSIVLLLPVLAADLQVTSATFRASALRQIGTPNLRYLFLHP